MHKQAGKTAILIPVIAVIAIAIGALVQSMQNKAPQAPEFKSTIILPQPKSIETAIAGAGLVDHNGDAVDLQALQGKWSLLFFGFTNCPDICPTTLQTLAQAKKQIAKAGLWSHFQVFMVTVDPARDTLEQLSKYVPFFADDFLGVASSIGQTEDFAKQLGILFVKRDSDEQGRYEVDHSASIILLNPQGRYAGVISAPHRADDIALDMIELAEFEGLSQIINTQPPLADNSSDNKQQVGGADLQLKNGWIRLAPPGATSMAAYFTLKNSSDQDIEISSTSSPAFANAMLHDTVIENGMAQMRHLSSLSVAAGEQTTLKPMSTHMMLMMPSRELKEGDRVDIELLDTNNKRHQFKLEVRASSPE